MKKKILIGVGIASIIVLLTLLVGYNIKYGQPKTNDTSTGVEEVDFSNYITTEVASTDSNVTITTAGVYNFTNDISNGAIIVNTNGDVKIVLDNITITNDNGPCINIISATNVYIEIKGNVTLNATTNSDYNGAIYSKNDLLLLGDGTLNIVSNIDGIVTKDDLQIDSGTYNITSNDDGIVGRDSIAINNGTITITSKGDGIKTTNEEKGVIDINDGTIIINAQGDGIASITDINVNGGTINIKTGSGSTTTSSNSNWRNSGDTASMKGIKTDQNLYINGGTIKINSEDDSIHSNGNVAIKGGTIEASSGDDGIHADKDVTISNAKITITKSYEGIEGANITINSGDISITASDDGFNAAGGDGSTMNRPGANNAYTSGVTYNLTINGGTIYVNASGDGLDSNGNIFITGGTIFVDGPTNNGNGALDYGDGGSYKFEITGGTLIAVGSSGMAVSPTNGTTQTSVLINLTNSYSETLTFGDITYTPAKSYNSILISSSSLETGKSYTLKINNKEVQTLSLSSKVTTSGSQGMNMGMLNGMMRR